MPEKYKQIETYNKIITRVEHEIVVPHFGLI